MASTLRYVIVLMILCVPGLFRYSKNNMIIKDISQQ